MATSMPPKASSSIDRAWAESFGAAISRPKLPQGDGWMTFKEVLAKYKLGQNRTHEMLKELMDKGLMDKFTGCVRKGNRQVMQIWYRPAKLGAIPQKRQSGTV